MDGHAGPCHESEGICPALERYAVSHCWSLGTEGRSSERYAYASGEEKAKLCGYCEVCVLLFGKLKFLLTPGGVFAIINCFILACGRNVPCE